MTAWLAIFNLGPTELIIIALVIVLLFGATKIPSLMRSMGQGIGEFKTGLKEGGKLPESGEKTTGAAEEKAEQKK